MIIRCPLCNQELSTCPTHCLECGGEISIIVSSSNSLAPMPRAGTKTCVIIIIILFLAMLISSVVSEAKSNVLRWNNLVLTYRADTLSQIVHHNALRGSGPHSVATPSAARPLSQPHVITNTHNGTMSYQLRQTALSNGRRNVAAFLLFGAVCSIIIMSMTTNGLVLKYKKLLLCGIMSTFMASVLLLLHDIYRH